MRISNLKNIVTKTVEIQVKYTIPVSGKPGYDIYREVVSYNADTDEYILAWIDGGGEHALSRESLEGRYKAVIIERVPEGYVAVPTEDLEN